MVSRSFSFASCYISLSTMLLCNISCSASALIVVVELIRTFLVCCAYSCLACLVLPPSISCLLSIFIHNAYFLFALYIVSCLPCYFLFSLYISVCLVYCFQFVSSGNRTPGSRSYSDFVDTWEESVLITSSHSRIVQRLPV